MHPCFFRNPRTATNRLIVSLVLLAFASVARAQEAASQVNSPGSNADWEQYDWLKPTADQQDKSAVKVSTGQDISDPFSVLMNGSLWQDKYGAVYTQQLADTLSLSYETSAITLSDGSNPFLPLSDDNSSDDLSRGQKLGLHIQPAPEVTFSGNVHNSIYDTSLPVDSTATTGAGFSAESHLPFNSVLTLGADSDRTGTDLAGSSVTHYTAYDAQYQQPLGKIPLTAVFKGHYEETTTAGAPASSLPSLEQSLVWKPAQDTTVQMGLRQQHYMDFPGISNEFNQALFADWSQKVAGDVTWHSYAEVLNSRGIQDAAPAVPLATGANGTPQASTPGPGLNSTLPLSLDTETLTFSTGPSFKIEKDISASIEYSNRWDQNPAPGNVGQEQRLSVSVKGSF